MEIKKTGEKIISGIDYHPIQKIDELKEDFDSDRENKIRPVERTSEANYVRDSTKGELINLVG